MSDNPNMHAYGMSHPVRGMIDAVDAIGWRVVTGYLVTCVCVVGDLDPERPYSGLRGLRPTGGRDTRSMLSETLLGSAGNARGDQPVLVLPVALIVLHV